MPAASLVCVVSTRDNILINHTPMYIRALPLVVVAVADAKVLIIISIFWLRAMPLSLICVVVTHVLTSLAYIVSTMHTGHANPFMRLIASRQSSSSPCSYFGSSAFNMNHHFFRISRHADSEHRHAISYRPCRWIYRSQQTYQTQFGATPEQRWYGPRPWLFHR